VDSGPARHSLGVAALSSVDALEDSSTVSGVAPRPCILPDFGQVYDEHAELIWRFVRRLGVTDTEADDVVQEVFLVAHQRRNDFEGRSTARTWLCGIALRVVKASRRRAQRHAEVPVSFVTEAADPCETLERRRALRDLDVLLGTLDDDKREVLVLSDIEQLSAPEISEAVGIHLSTVYSRLSAARKEFSEAVKRHRARDGWRYR